MSDKKQRLLDSIAASKAYCDKYAIKISTLRREIISIREEYNIKAKEVGNITMEYDFAKKNYTENDPRLLALARDLKRAQFDLAQAKQSLSRLLSYLGELREGLNLERATLKKLQEQLANLNEFAD